MRLFVAENHFSLLSFERQSSGRATIWLLFRSKCTSDVSLQTPAGTSVSEENFIEKYSICVLFASMASISRIRSTFGAIVCLLGQDIHISGSPESSCSKKENLHVQLAGHPSVPRYNSDQQEHIRFANAMYLSRRILFVRSL